MLDEVKAIIGRPIPQNATARDIILNALIEGKPRSIGEGETRLMEALPELLDEGVVVSCDDGLRLAPGAMDAAMSARNRMTAARKARAEWGAQMQAVLRDVRLRRSPHRARFQEHHN